MALKAVLNSLDGVDEVLKEHYIEKDGKFFLDVTKTDGLALENVDGLKNTVEKLRTSEKNLQAEVKTAEDALRDHRNKFKGLDPEAAKSALNKIDEIKNWDGETKVREAVTVAEQKAQAKLDDLVSQHNTEKSELNDEIAGMQSQLQDAIVKSKIVEAISKENGNVDVLLPHVRSQVNMVKDGKGQWRPEVVNANGDPRIGGSDGSDMTILQLVQEMKSQDTFAACFTGANQSGSGKKNSSESGTHKESKGKVIAASDQEGMSASLEDIASGETEVDMSQ
jgi:DNA-directed RNA polymerase subunit F